MDISLTSVQLKTVLIVNKAEKKSVQFDEQVKVKVLEPEVVEINEEKIDKLLHLLHEADPTGERGDNEELLHLEGNDNYSVQFIL